MLLTACGSNATASSAGSPPLSKAAAGQTYLSDIAAVHSATTAFQSAAALWNLTTTDAQASSDAAPLIAAEQNFNSELNSTSWPQNAQADIRALTQQNNVIIADLGQLKSITHATIGAWNVNIRKDTAVDVSDSNSVRSDLGLPAV
jgi:thiamine pyrophosphate-dependent acetolactate synthase large subunit-like protein